jgi:23S rRNA pseudouridine1911/1915/1917 synthase
VNRGFSYREQIGPRSAGTTVLQHLTREYRHSSAADWQARLLAQEVALDDGAATGAETLRLGQWLVWHRPGWTEPEVPLSYDLLLEDDDLLAVAKPGGLPTMPNGDFLEHTLLHIVRQRAPEADPMHRLGRGTSGVVLFAKTAPARTRLQEAWRAHAVRKVYVTRVDGQPDWETLTIRQPIGLVPHPLLGEIHAASPTGRTAVSHARVLERRVTDSLVEVVIDTGRPHQIRIHLAAAGHPLTGDPLYGPGGHARPDAVPSELGYQLHAASLSFVHPRDGQPIVVTAPLPPGLALR